MTLPKIAITMGDPAGVGPEICLQAIRQPTVLSNCVPIIFGDAGILRDVAELLDLGFPDTVLSTDEWLASPAGHRWRSQPREWRYCSSGPWWHTRAFPRQRCQTKVNQHCLVRNSKSILNVQLSGLACLLIFWKFYSPQQNKFDSEMWAYQLATHTLK